MRITISTPNDYGSDAAALAAIAECYGGDAATRDCALMNSAEAMPVSNPAHASLITKLSHAEDDLLRALGLADVATEEAERLRARITELEAVIGDCLRDLIAMFPDEWNPGAPLLMHYTKYKLREALKGEAT